MIRIEIKSIFEKVLFVYEDKEATLKKAVEQAIKEKADLSWANLRSANLSSANLRSANLSWADLRSANLSSANLRSANLRSANLSSADLSSANLSWANLSWADLRSANLSWANLRSANLSWANLSSADLSWANLRSATNQETAIIPIYSKWSIGIKGDIIVIGCKEQTIAQWDEFFISDREYDTKRGTEDFKRVQANYEAVKAYFNFLNKQ